MRVSSRRTALRAGAALAAGAFACARTAGAQQAFPAVGHKYLVDFKAFHVELFFESATKLTWTGIRPDGSRGDQGTEAITVEPIADQVFLVTWQESDKTTVVHVEDYARRTIITNITDNKLNFVRFHGTFTQIA